jgi:DNA-binding NtrC family response regulator
VDDEPAIRLLCRVNLEHEGYEVREAATVAAARDALSHGSVAAVLLDMHLGSDNGLGLLDELAGREPHVPFAVVSGSTDLHQPRFRQADAVLSKPYSVEQLTTTVRTLVAAS